MNADTWQVEQIRWERAWSRADRSPNTLESYIAGVSSYFDWCDQENKQTSSLASADLYIDHLQRSRSRHVARLHARAIKAYGRFLLDEYEDGNPFAKLKLPPEPQPSAKHSAMATHDDLSKLLATCDRSTMEGERDHCILVMLAATGMRRGEVAALTLDDIDLVSQTIHVRKGKTEAARRTMHMPDVLQGALLRYLKVRTAKIDKERGRRIANGYAERVGNALWITHTLGSPVLSPNGFTQMLRKRGLRAGVDVRAHAFRRMHAGQWMAKGGSETGLMANSGWKSTAMIAHYTRDVKEANAIAEARRLAEIS